jgi:uncharacterized membrane protein
MFTSRKKPPHTVEEVTAENVQTIAQLERAAQLEESLGDRIAELINRVCGSMTFLWFNVLLFTVWISLNAFVLEKPWDPFPFSFLTLVVSLEAIFLSIFLLIAANRAAFVNERRSHLDLQIDLLAEQENTETMKLLYLIAAKVGVEEKARKDYEVLAQATSAKKLVAQIDSLRQGAVPASAGEETQAPRGGGVEQHPQ